MIHGILEDLPAAFRLGLAGLGTVGIYLFGGWDAILKALIALVAIDFVTGVLAAKPLMKRGSCASLRYEIVANHRPTQTRMENECGRNHLTSR